MDTGRTKPGVVFLTNDELGLIGNAMLLQRKCESGEISKSECKARQSQYVAEFNAMDRKYAAQRGTGVVSLKAMNALANSSTRGAAGIRQYARDLESGAELGTYDLMPAVYPPFWNEKGELEIPDQNLVRQRLARGKSGGSKRVGLFSEGHLKTIGFLSRPKEIKGQKTNSRGQTVTQYGPTIYTPGNIQLKGTKRPGARTGGAVGQRGMKESTYGEYLTAGGTKTSVTRKTTSRIAQLAARGAPGAPSFNRNPKFSGSMTFDQPKPDLQPGESIIRQQYMTKDGQQRARYAIVKATSDATVIGRNAANSQDARLLAATEMRRPVTRSMTRGARSMSF